MRRDWRLLFEAMLIVPAVRIALWTLPFRFVHSRVARPRTPRGGDVSIERVLRAVQAIARRVPRATCLTRAMAARVMLARHGHETTLRFGVAKEEGRVAAHAWLEKDGAVIFEGPALMRPMTASPAPTR